MIKYCKSDVCSVNLSNKGDQENKVMIRSSKRVLSDDDFNVNDDLADMNISPSSSDINNDEYDMEQEKFDSPIYEFDDFVFSYNPVTKGVEVL